MPAEFMTDEQIAMKLQEQEMANDNDADIAARM